MIICLTGPQSKDPCNQQSYGGISGYSQGRNNPCGGGSCIPGYSGSYSCACAPPFTAVTNLDGSQTCAPGGFPYPLLFSMSSLFLISIITSQFLLPLCPSISMYLLSEESVWSGYLPGFHPSTGQLHLPLSLGIFSKQIYQHNTAHLFSWCF